MKKIIIAVTLVLAISASAAADSFFSFHIGSQPRHHRTTRVIARHHHLPSVVIRRQTVRVVYQPAGHWEWREVRVWEPGYYESVWVPPRHEIVFVSGHFDEFGRWVNGYHEQRLVEEGHHQNVWHPGHYRIERKKVWVPY